LIVNGGGWPRRHGKVIVGAGKPGQEFLLQEGLAAESAFR